MLTTVPIFSTDMYLPALPKMVELFGTSLKLLNLTLILFFIFFAASSLVWGTLSDKYGRKPILITSISAYVVASFLCAIAGNVYQLILFRAIQGIGGGATMAVAIAMVKDVFSGKERGRVLVYLSSLMAVAPIVAPIVGAQILQVTSWRGTFVILGLFGTLLIVGSLLLSETAVRNPDKSVLKTFSSLKTLLKNPGFSLPLILFSIASMPILMFVGSASDIYITGFGLSEQTFSFFFGFNAAFAVIGPFAYILLARRFSTQAIIGLAFLLTAASGIWIVLSGNQSPVMFALAIVPSALGSSLSRPPNMNIILEQGKKDTGAASSLMNFSFMMTGCTGMLFISLDWENRILVYGLSALVAGLVPLLLWPMAWRRCDPAQLEANTETAQLGSY
jgi:MFS transporter, DHA1 family, multidrug resistance protein